MICHWRFGSVAIDPVDFSKIDVINSNNLSNNIKNDNPIVYFDDSNNRLKNKNYFIKLKLQKKADWLREQCFDLSKLAEKINSLNNKFS